MPDDFDLADLEARVARVDPDRYMASRFAPPADRPRLTALYAFNYEIARVREQVSEPALGAMRLQWWRDAVEEIYDPRRKVRRHEAAVALGDAFRTEAPPRIWVDRLINARGRDLDSDPFTSLAELRDYSEATAGTLMRVAAWMLAPQAELSERAESAIAHAGAAWALTGMIRALPLLVEQGRPGLPLDLFDLTGADTVADAAHDPETWRKALAPVIDLAREELEFARAGYDDVPPEMAPALIYAALVPTYLARAAKREDPLREEVQAPKLERQARLVAASARGRL